MDPSNEIHLTRLFKACESSYRGLEPFRNLNRGLIEEYAGSGYGSSSRVRYETYLNLMNQAVDAYTMTLVANRPRVMVNSQKQHLTYFAKQFELAINNYIQQIGLEYTLRQWVLDAFFCLGVVKTHMADAGAVQVETDLWMDPGQPFASNLSLDNFVYDLNATKYSEVRYAADMYRMPHEDLKSGMFEQALVDEIVPTSKYTCNDERLAMISKGYEVDHDEFEPMVDLADIWVPRDGKIYTFQVKSVAQFQLTGKPLAVMEWDGSEFGPYHLLGFSDVPENIMPTSPASHLATMARLINNIMRKQAKRARNQKRVHTYTPAGAEGAKNIQKHGDDAFVEMQDTNEFKTQMIGGPDPAAQLFLDSSVQTFDRAAGNLTAMLGLGAQADTASQEQLIQGAVSKKAASMQYRVVDASVRLIRALGGMLWSDKFKTIRSSMPIQGAEGYSVDMTWTPEDREGEFSDYDLNVDMYSMPHVPPSQKVAALNGLITGVYAPLSQHFLSQGGSFDFAELTDLYANLLNMPEIRRAIKTTTPIQEEMGSARHDRESRLGPTSHEYTRRSVASGQPSAGKSQQAWASLAQAQPE